MKGLLQLGLELHGRFCINILLSPTGQATAVPEFPGRQGAGVDHGTSRPLCQEHRRSAWSGRAHSQSQGWTGWSSHSQFQGWTGWLRHSQSEGWTGWFSHFQSEGWTGWLRHSQSQGWTGLLTYAFSQSECLPMVVWMNDER